jgi:hypothetical protein
MLILMLCQKRVELEGVVSGTEAGGGLNAKQSIKDHNLLSLKVETLV